MWASLAQAAAQFGASAVNAEASVQKQLFTPPSNLSSGAGGIFNSFDNSGWTVSTGSSKASATAGDRGGQSAVPPAAFMAAASPGGFAAAAPGGVDASALLLVGGLVLAVVLLRRKG